MHTRSLLSLWLCLLLAVLPSLVSELLHSFDTAYLFLGSWVVGCLGYLIFRLLFSGSFAAGGASKGFLFLVPLWFLVILFLTVLLIENFGTRIVHSLMLHSDARFYNVTLILTAAFLSRGGVKVLGRMAEILLPLFSAVLLVFTPFVLFSAPSALLNPPPATAWTTSLLPNAAIGVLLASGGVFFFCDEPITVTEHSKKQCLYAAFFATVYALLIPLLTVKLSGRFLVRQSGNSFFLALRQFESFPNAHILFTTLWVLLILVLCAYFFWALQKLLHRRFPKVSEKVFFWVVPLLITLILGIRNETQAYFSQSLWYGVILTGIPLFFGVPAGITLLARRSSKPPSANR